jgi:hypothetical protein
METGTGINYLKRLKKEWIAFFMAVAVIGFLFGFWFGLFALLIFLMDHFSRNQILLMMFGVCVFIAYRFIYHIFFK